MKKNNEGRMFPDSRGVLFVFCPVLGLFFAGFAYYVDLWSPTSGMDKIGQAVFLEILFSFITLCVVGFLASIVGIERLRPVIQRVGAKAALAGFVLVVPMAAGFLLALLYCIFTR